MLANQFPRTTAIHRRYTIGIGTVLLACIAIFATCQPFSSLVKPQVTIAEETFYQRFVSPSGNWEVLLLAEAGWAFAPHTITVLRRDMTAIDSDRGTLITRFELHNDGANLSDSNCVIAWQMNGAQEQAILTCDGEEQEAQQYEIDLTTATLLGTTDLGAE